MWRYNKVYLHIDVNSAFLSWEAVYRLQNGETLDLRNIPSAIGGDVESRRGVILAKSLPAKRLGVVTGEPISDALKKCPNLVVARGNFELYRRCSRAMFEIVKKYSDNIEIFSIDECYVDISDMRLLYSDPIDMANEIRNDIKDTLGFTVSIGISDNMMLAKMASDLKKPDAVSTIYSNEIKAKMWNLPIRDLYMIGRKTAPKLEKIGILTIGDLAKSDKSFILQYLGVMGDIAWSYANGICFTEIGTQNVESSAKSIGNSTTTRYDITKEEDALAILSSLTKKVIRRLTEDEMLAKTVCVYYKSTDFEVFEHQGTHYRFTDSINEIFQKVAELFKTLWDGRSIRALGVRVTNLIKTSEHQVDFYDIICRE